MSTDAGNAAAPEDSATRDVASERPGLESGDPDSADSATSTPESADRGVDGSATTDSDSDSPDTHIADTDSGTANAGDSAGDST
ncbi:MAG: hypothetical protein QOK35_1323, partial [Pseudonocardiales bacterium]|nr:hypothetical protein [Pseudonocardiales bacterium]